MFNKQQMCSMDNNNRLNSNRESALNLNSDTKNKPHIKIPSPKIWVLKPRQEWQEFSYPAQYSNLRFSDDLAIADGQIDEAAEASQPASWNQFKIWFSNLNQQDGNSIHFMTEV